MELILTKKPRNPIIIEGFPGFGLVGTITTEYLIQQLDCELIGKYWFENLPATIAIHDEKIVHPIGIFYNEKYNLIIVHAITAGIGIEWEVCRLINKLVQELGAVEVISLEGIGSMDIPNNPKTFFYTNDQKRREVLSNLKIEPLREGIIVGVTSTLLLNPSTTVTTILAETHSELPDSKAAAKIIEVLDKYIGLNIDTKPLLETAKKFEEKINRILEQSNDIKSKIQKKQLSYVG